MAPREAIKTSHDENKVNKDEVEKGRERNLRNDVPPVFDTFIFLTKKTSELLPH